MRELSIENLRLLAEDEDSKVPVPYHQRKLEIIDKIESLPPGKKKKDITAECNITPNTLSTILKNKDKLQAKQAIGSNTKTRHKDPTHLEVDAALFQWFTAARLQSIPISGELLKAKAE